MPEKKTDDLLVTLMMEMRDEQKEHTILLTRMEHDIARNTDDLEEHIRRTNILEEKVEGLYSPIDFTKNAGYFIIKSAAVVGALASILKYFGAF